MTHVRTATLATAGTLAALMAGTTMVAAAPLPVNQTPARATGISGMLFPGAYEVRVAAETVSTPGSVQFSSVASQSACATTIGRSLLRIAWRNATTGKAGAVTVKTCNNGYNPTVPVRAVADTGIGAITFVATVTGSRDLPTAGQPAVPGSGRFAV